MNINLRIKYSLLQFLLHLPKVIRCSSSLSENLTQHGTHPLLCPLLSQRIHSEI